MKILVGIIAYTIINLTACLYYNLVLGHSIFGIKTAMKEDLYNPDFLITMYFFADFCIIEFVPALIYLFFVLLFTKRSPS